MAEHNEEDWNGDPMVFESLMNSFPKKQTRAKQFEVVHPLGDGSKLTWTLSLSSPEFGLPFGLDRELLQWLLQRALRTREANVSWEVLLEYLGPDSSAMEKEGVYFAARRLGMANATWRRKDGSWGGFQFIGTQVSSDEETSEVNAPGAFTGETEFIFDLVFLWFVERTQFEQKGSSSASCLSGYSIPAHGAALSYVPFRWTSIIDPK